MSHWSSMAISVSRLNAKRHHDMPTSAVESYTKAEAYCILLKDFERRKKIICCDDESEIYRMHIEHNIHSIFLSGIKHKFH